MKCFKHLQKSVKGSFSKFIRWCNLWNMRSILFCFFILSVPVCSAQTPSIISIDNLNLEKASTITFPINIEVNDENGLVTTTLTIYFDPEVVQLSNVINGDFDQLAYNIDNQSGFVKILTFQTGPNSVGPGQIQFANIELKAVGAEGSKSDLLVEVNTLKNVSGIQVPFEKKIGTIKIDGQISTENIQNFELATSEINTNSINEENKENKEIISLDIPDEAIELSVSSTINNTNEEVKAQSTPSFSSFSFILIIFVLKIFMSGLIKEIN